MIEETSLQQPDIRSACQQSYEADCVYGVCESAAGDPLEKARDLPVDVAWIWRRWMVVFMAKSRGEEGGAQHLWDLRDLL